ncbi:non-ribosomal peptide synthetase [Aquimarina sediminis]|uniref:non-ribosomal peptide synthetase n=1 Tax=Aquimarina sediminis TaxID=2070536 RepID=UPI000CA04EB2|nr:non-ribosomal peptide synthetase [Aquimarina sediminis]
MNTASLIKGLRENGVVVKLVDNQLEVILLKEKTDENLLEELKKHKQEVIDYLSLISNKDRYKEIPKVKKSDSYPVSNAQLRIWLESQTEKASVAYNMPFEIYLTGIYDIAILEKAIRYITGRHEILRTVFKLNSKKELRQYIQSQKETHFKIDYKDFRENPNPKNQAQSYIKAQTNIPFDLEQGPLIKVSVLQYKTEGYIFFCNLHHSICDAWSLPILKREILTVYKSLSAGKKPELPELRIQYKDYASWYTNKLQSKSLIQQEKYWLNQFSDEIPTLEFPLKKTRLPVKTYNGQTLKAYFEKKQTEMIRTYQHQKGGSLYMVMLGTLYVMLGKYTGANDISIGSPFAAREHADLKNQIGFYTNTLAIRNKLEKTDTFNGFFRKVKQSVLEAYNNQQYPFEELVKNLKIKKDPSRNPLFDVMLVVLPNDTVSEDEINEVEINTISVEKNTTSKFDLLFCIEEIGRNISFKIEYNTDLYEESIIRQFIEHYKKVVELLLLRPDEKVATINYLPKEGVYNEEIDLKKYQPKTVISLFEDQVVKTPEAIAVYYKDTFLTYQQLNEFVNQIASCLKQLPQITTKNVGVLLDRSHYNVIAMLGVIKSGACYVPINAEYTEDRKQFIINDAEIETVISTTDICKAPLIDQAKVIHLDTFDFSEWNSKNPVIVNSLDDTAFIIYTSGSTGNPKGVAQTHKMLSNLTQWNIHDACISLGSRHLQYTSFSFDVSIQDCWFVLSSGGTLYVTPESMKIDFFKLSQYIVKNKIEVLSFPFSALSNFFKYVDKEFYKKHRLKHIISSGEQLTIDSALERFLLNSSEVKLHNHYGPSETHVVTSYTLSIEENNVLQYVPIGKPIANTVIHILDSNLQPVPQKVTGEIYIGGDNLAKGYVKLPELTKERFIVNPFQKTERLYKTGDLGYKDDKGIITYLGRNDDQVKIRGYRIELAEIKNTLLSLNNIHQTFIDIIDRKGEKVIVAFITGTDEVDKQFLRKQLSKRLPEYMIPSYMVVTDCIPLTSNGKIDKKRLPDVTDEALTKAKYVAPKTQIEIELVRIWENVLEVSSIGVLDNFFELGGHSLYITRMLYEINETFDVKLQVKNVFASQNIQELAKLIEDEVVFKNGISANQTEQIKNDKNSEVWEI